MILSYFEVTFDLNESTQVVILVAVMTLTVQSQVFGSCMCDRTWYQMLIFDLAECLFVVTSELWVGH